MPSKTRTRKSLKPERSSNKLRTNTQNEDTEENIEHSPKSISPFGGQSSLLSPSSAFESCKFNREQVSIDAVCLDDENVVHATTNTRPVRDSTSLACKEETKIQPNKPDLDMATVVSYKSKRDLMEEELLLAEEELRIRKMRLEFERKISGTYQVDPVFGLSSERLSSNIKQSHLNDPDNLSSAANDRMYGQQVTNDTMRTLHDNLRSLCLGVGLPKIEVEPFDGSPRQFWSFVKGFEAAVVDKLVDEGQKLSYLLYYCKGRAKQAIEHCVFLPKEEGYTQAMKILETQFGKPHQVVHAISKELFDGPKLHHNDVEGLRQLAIQMKGCEITFTQMKRTAEIDCTTNLLRLVERLPRGIQEKWIDVAARIIDMGREPSFNDLLIFIDKQVARSSSIYGQLISSVGKGCDNKADYSKPLRCHANTIQINSIQKPMCPLCNVSHELYSCDRFRQSTAEERRQIAFANKRCFLCLKANHLARFCRSNAVCTEDGCGNRHHPLLHANLLPRTSSESLECGATSAGSKCVRLGYVPVRLRGPLGSIETYAFVDNGSDTTLISDEIANTIGLKGDWRDITVRTLNGSKSISCKSVNVQVQSIFDNSSIDIYKAFTVSNLPIARASLPDMNELNKWTHLKGIEFKKLDCDKVGILLGCDVPELHWVLDQRIGAKNQPFAIKSVLGWILRGPVSQETYGKIAQINYLKSNELLEDIQKMYDLEFTENEPPDTKANSVEDEKALSLALHSIRHSDGHYEVGLPWRNNGAELCANRKVAESRLALLKGRLLRNPELKSKYDFTIRDHEKKGYVRQVTSEAAKKRRWFVPHHYVVNVNKPGKIRVVFDCAAVHNGTSLNKALLQGPDLTNNLVGVLLRFRKYSVAISADIEEMFLQVRVPDRDKWALSFLYWADDSLEGSPMMYEMNVHPFGATSSPFCANLALRKTATDNSTDFSDLTVAAVKSNFYVDDCLLSVETEEEALNVAIELMQLLKRGGFHLTKWMSNKHSVMSNLLKEDKAKVPVNLDLHKVESQRALGLQWRITDDSFGFTLHLPNAPFTKRGILRCIASFYDPLGFAAPMLLPARKLLQDLSYKPAAWDTEVDKSEREIWLKWLGDIRSVMSMHIDRCLMPNSPCPGTVELHVFSDASEVGYGAVGYLRYTSLQGIYCRFLIGKSRVTPRKNMTIPRLELVAAVLATKLMKHLAKELQVHIDREILWTDSTIVLQYIRNTSARFATFVANRVRMILDRSAVDQWRHVPTRQNPADVASRGAFCATSKEMNLWLNGPSFLHEVDEYWPTNPIVLPDVTSEDPEVRHVCLMSTEERSPSIIDRLSDRYSDWWKLLKAIAWLRRFIDYIRAMKSSDTTVTVRIGHLHVQEMQQATRTAVRLTQADYFSNEIKALERNPEVLHSTGSLKPLRPTLRDRVIYLGGRVAVRESLSFNELMILPPRGRTTELIVQHYHEMQGHAGASHVLASVRQKFWIIKGMATVRRILAKCLKCKTLFPKPLSQVMAPLPSCRITCGDFPFWQCGVDYFGPFYVKIGRSKHKRYGCLFTCLQTRAIHLEVAHSMTADSFLMAMTRFIARRGKPRFMYSDNGSNFVAAESEMRSLLLKVDQERIRNKLLRSDIDWKFQPPTASHRGGVWERMIRSTRRILSAVSTQQTLTDETLLTYIIEVERIVNDRPLVPVYDDPSSPQALSPNDLLLLRSNPTSFVGEVTLAERYTKGWRQAQYLASVFWKRWRREYLPTLQACHKWLKVKQDLKVGDFVLLIDGSAPCGVWPKGVVSQVFPGSDGHIRQVLVRTNSGVLRRDIRSLSLMEGVSLPQ